MKKIEKLNKALALLQKQIDLVSFERKDTSYRRSGGYFGTKNAVLSDVIVVKQYARSKYLNTYICVNKTQIDLVEKFKISQIAVDIEEKRLAKIYQNNWAKISIIKATEHVFRDIEIGVIHTNYGKCFILGNNNIYYAHPYYGHSDYNKWCAMPNTAKHRKIASELNAKIEAAKQIQKTA